MSINDFTSLFARTAFGTRSARRIIATALATCIIFIAASDGNAAANRFTKFAPTPYFSPVSPAKADETSPASFNDRFDCRQTSVIRDFLESPASRILLPLLTPMPPLTTASLPPQRKHQKIIPAGKTIVGIASMYNPTDPNDLDAGNEELASGERYDANGWTAAIRTDLRKKFGGVRFGRNYRPAFALVQNAGKQLIVKINDVGPLRRGRIIDLNKRAMSYFDPTLQLGLIGNVKVTPLADRDWALGPIVDDRPVSIASRFDRQIR